MRTEKLPASSNIMSAIKHKNGILHTMKKDLVNHRGAYGRLALYLSISLMTGLISNLSGLTEAKVLAMFWWDWSVFIFSPVLSTLLVWRSFIDSSLKDSVETFETTTKQTTTAQTEQTTTAQTKTEEIKTDTPESNE